MSKKTKVLKYKVVNTNIDKKFIGKNLDLERIKSNGGHMTKPRVKAPIWFIEFRDEQREINKSVMQRFDEQTKFNKSLINRINNIVKINNLKQ